MKQIKKESHNKGWQDGKVKTGRDIGIVIARLSPAHLGHEYLIKEALKKSDRLIVILGSANKAPDIKNPWSDLDRVAMLSSVVQANNLNQAQIRYESVQDHFNNDTWLIEVRTKLSSHINHEDNVTLYGNDKDHSTYYLHFFPEWNLEEVGSYEPTLNATKIRNLIFSDRLDLTRDLVPACVYEYLISWTKSTDFQRLQSEYNHLATYKKQFENLKYDVFFVTVDAVITHRGRVLVIKRKAKGGIGDGLLSMPGGFINSNERLKSGILRIVKEKTGISLREEWIKRQEVFDSPERSLRGRIITHVFKVSIPTSREINRLDSTIWINFAEVSLHAQNFFEDHSLIIKEMLK